MPKPKKTDSKPQRTAPSNPTAPDWPPLRPLLPALDLSLTPLLTDQIYLIRNFLSGSLCKNYVSFLASLPLTTTPGKPKKDEAVRVNDRFQIEDARFAEMLWSGTALKELVTERFTEEDYNDDREEDSRDPAMSTELAQRARQLWGGEPLGLNPNIRIYRYSAGQFFGQHYDESNSITFPPSPTTPKPTPARTTWTLLIYLTSCNGGETIFYPDPTRANPNPTPISVPPETGMALLHRHGDQCMLHEGNEVTGGEKWVLRSDLVVAR
ncbi:hypothetical protein NUU61_004897 [Penicillium alfredii]|uniref:Fe2OG dioxygenase domain-containing protein n=1 Tax=Penicillium alfredii TaxID=1506179 RepID=A0A9W9F8G3_9EURO|nr:uncharacterized protein NUU61_004897 [Penicillium alfredii]KAJ5095541.1 hypothetical protein NUU61_004897 [Penicillium alfredii]